MLAQTHAASLRLGAYARPGGIPGFPNMVALPYQQQVCLVVVVYLCELCFAVYGWLETVV